jgi:hypothetical protein
MIKKHTKQALAINHSIESGSKPSGNSHPPKKQIDKTNESHIMLLYSAKKNSANVMAEYSIL